MYNEKIVSYNPATGDELGSVDVTSKQDIKRIVSMAKETFPKWSQTQYSERAEILSKLADEIENNCESIAKLVTMEMGRPIKESMGEVQQGANLIRYFIENTIKCMTPENIDSTGDKKVRIIYEPIGVVAAIKPWNMPVQTPIWSIIPALLAGNVVVFKSSENTMLIEKKFEELTKKVGFPEGVWSFVYGGKETGNLLLGNDIDMVSFTGSVTGGQEVSRKVAGRFVKVSLGLGGKDPMIVLPDADLDFAASAAIWGSMTNCGQFCCSIERVFVHKSIYDKFLEKVIENVSKLRVGNGINENTDIGPIVNRQQYEHVLGQINDAVEKGAKVLCGGSGYESGELSKGYFIQPTVIVNLSQDMNIMKYETFGPVIRVVPFDNEEQVIAMANNSMYGLGASIITQDNALFERVASRMEVGMVWANEPFIPMPTCPWIGSKATGNIRELGDAGIKEFLKPKLISTQFNDNDKARPWWFPY